MIFPELIPLVNIIESPSHMSGTGLIPVIGLSLILTLKLKDKVFVQPIVSVIVRDKLYPDGIL
ncbi:MAG: hypothetical protein BWX61_00908 [Bacteroidetes bacterium ADurb.Bin035]|nr:MAG: hypothetical protein BWX61_00908 [Bacteroidetes bacterium ADurb.Bin035]